MQNKQVTNKQIVTALILGDGTLQWRPESGTYSIRTYSHKSYEDYHKYKTDLMKRCFIKKINECVRGDKKNLISYVSSKELVKPYYNFLYSNGKKDITKFLLRMNHPLCLAIWFMDDGSCSGKKSKRKDGRSLWSGYDMWLGTNQFNYHEHEYMVAWFKREFGITPIISEQKYNNPKHCKYGKSQYRLYFKKSESQKIYSLIKDYVEPIKSMRHKFRFAYYLDTLNGDPFDVDFEIN